MAEGARRQGKCLETLELGPLTFAKEVTNEGFVDHSTGQPHSRTAEQGRRLEQNAGLAGMSFLRFLDCVDAHTMKRLKVSSRTGANYSA